MTPQLLGLALLIGQPADDPTAFINQYLAAYQRDEKITPSGRCTDHEFLRRASLDLIGRIPTLPEIAAFMKAAPEQRRRLLIDRLLKEDDHARHWANEWTGWLLEPAPPSADREAFHGWLAQHFAQNGSHKELAEKLLTAKGTMRDNPAVHFFITLRGEMVPKDVAKNGQYEMVPLTNNVIRAFHGRRISCVQCHDHPYYDALLQNHFWGINAFFRQVEFKPAGKDEAVGDNPELNMTGMVGYERRNGVFLFTDATFLDGKKIPRKDFLVKTRRESFVGLLIAHPDFARSHVNRVWTYLLGRSLFEAPEADELDSPALHPKLLDRLAQDFVKSGHDPKALLRWICLSDAYGASSIANKTNDSSDSAIAFSRQQLRVLSNEQVIESLLTAFGLPKSEWPKQRRAWLKEFWVPRFELPPDTEPEPPGLLGLHREHRMLWLMASESFQRAMTHKDGTLASIMKQHKEVTAPAVRLLYLHTLSRPPTPAEEKRLLDIPRANPRLKVNPQFWRDYYEDIFWALLNSSEFAFNH